jgi:hypothetical protein
LRGQAASWAIRQLPATNQVDTDADGNFVITVDSTPTGERRNHLWLPPARRTC